MRGITLKCSLTRSVSLPLEAIAESFLIRRSLQRLMLKLSLQCPQYYERRAIQYRLQALFANATHACVITKKMTTKRECQHQRKMQARLVQTNSTIVVEQELKTARRKMKRGTCAVACWAQCTRLLQRVVISAVIKQRRGRSCDKSCPELQA